MQVQLIRAQNHGLGVPLNVIPNAFIAVVFVEPYESSKSSIGCTVIANGKRHEGIVGGCWTELVSRAVRYRREDVGVKLGVRHHTFGSMLQFFIKWLVSTRLASACRGRNFDLTQGRR